MVALPSIPEPVPAPQGGIAGDIPPSPSPPLSRKAFNALIHDFMTAPDPLVDIAGNSGLTLRTLAEQLATPTGLAILETHRKLIELRRAAILGEAQLAAIQTLQRLATTSETEETARRAAAALLRFRTPIAPEHDPASEPARATAPDPAPPQSAPTNAAAHVPLRHPPSPRAAHPAPPASNHPHPSSPREAPVQALRDPPAAHPALAAVPSNDHATGAQPDAQDPVLTSHLARPP